MAKRLSVIIPSLGGELPRGLQEDPRIEVIVVKGISPVGKARAEGLRCATGDYIAWADADDVLLGGWNDGILAAIEQNPDVVFLGYQIDGVVTGCEGDVVKRVLQGRRMMSLWSVVSRRELWDGVFFDETAQVMEDWGVLLKIFERARRVLKIDRPIYQYVVNPNSTTHRGDHAAEVARRLGLWQEEFRKSPLHKSWRYRIAAFEGVWRMKRWFRI